MNDRPNIILIITDQQRFDAMSAHGNPICPTPNLDALATRSIDFTAAYCPMPLCSPSRASLMTGRSVPSHGLFCNSPPPLDTGEVCFTQLLADSGYSCALSGKWHLGHELTAQRGFTRWVNHRGGWREYLKGRGIAYEYAAAGHHRFGFPSGPRPPLQGLAVVSEEDSMVASVTRHARRMLKELQGEQPFFLNYSIFEPHPPIEAPEPYYSMTDPADVPLPGNFDDDLAGKPAYQHTVRGRPEAAHLDEDGWRKMRAVYFASVAMIDHQVGLFLNDVRAAGLYENTLIIFVADHGDMTGNHRMCYKGPHFYEELMRLPLLIHFPGQTTAGTYHGLAAMEDLAPTILQMAGASVPDALEGRSLVPVSRGEAISRDAVFAVRGLDPEEPSTGRMVRTKQWKYVWHPADLDELYDVVNDPGEMHNLAAAQAPADVVQDLRAQLKAWTAEVGDALAGRI